MRLQRFKEGDLVWSKKDRGMTLHDGDHRRPSVWKVMKAHTPKEKDEWQYDLALRTDLERRVLHPVMVRGVFDHRLEPWEGE